MAGLGAKKFVDTEVLYAADVNGYLMEQSIMRFATTTARDAAFGGATELTLAEGMTCYIDADNSLYSYDGSAWVKVVSSTTPPGLVFIAGGSFTGITTGAPLDVNSVFSSEYTNYVLHLRAVASVAQTDVRFRMRTVAAQENTAVYNYGWGGAWVTATPTYYFAGYSQNNPFAPDTSFYSGISPNVGYSGTTRIEIFSPNAARATRFAAQAYTDYTTVYNVALTGTGEVSTTSQYTGFRIFPIAGSIAGEYTLYGYRN